MTLLNNFDTSSNFWESNPQMKILFAEEFKKKVSSSHMWGLFLYAHPSSKLYNESPSIRKSIILKDFAKDLAFDDYKETLSKIERFVLTKAEKLLSTWERKLHERDEFINEQQYSIETYDILDKMLGVTPKLWDQYFSILKQLSEESSKTFGDVEESLIEKQII